MKSYFTVNIESVIRVLCVLVFGMCFGCKAAFQDACRTTWQNLVRSFSTAGPMLRQRHAALDGLLQAKGATIEMCLTGHLENIELCMNHQ